MADPIPNDTPARRALIDALEGESFMIELARSTSEEDAAELAQWLDETAQRLSLGPRRSVLSRASAEIHEALRARGLLVTSRGKLAQIADDAELERRYQMRRDAGADPDARRDDGGA